MGDKRWLLTDARAYSYRDMDLLACRFANGLAKLGVKRGDTVLVMLNNCIEFIGLWCALAKIGAVQVPVNVYYKGRLLSYLIKDSRARLMIVDAEFLPRLTEVAGDIADVATVVIRGEASENVGAARLLPFGDIVSDRDHFDAVPLKPWDQVAVMYTSGTTGPSKGVVVTHGHAHEYARGVIDMTEIRASDVYYAPLPLFHIAGQWAVIYCAAIAGATAVLPDAFSPQRYWDVCRRHKVTCSFLLGAMASLLYRATPSPDDGDNPLERVLVVPLFPEVEDFKRRFKLLVSTTWGCAEMNCHMEP
jgi:crotonobetaine/carnitine-CoA ligase